MKIAATCAALLVTLSAGATVQVWAKLVSQRVIDIPPGGAPILVCRYAGPAAHYEVVASTPVCAPYLAIP